LDRPEVSYDHPSPGEREDARNLSATSLNTGDNFDVITQFNEFSCAIFKSHDIRKWSEYAYMRLSKEVKVEYHEIYGSVEKQSLLCKQVGGTIIRDDLTAHVAEPSRQEVTDKRCPVRTKMKSKNRVELLKQNQDF
jgi:phosphoenolpyruvate carboxylase